MVNRTRAFRFSRRNEKTWSFKVYIVTRILIATHVASRRRRVFRTKVACIKNNVLLCFYFAPFYVFLACPMLHFLIASIYVCYKRAIPSFTVSLPPEIFWLHERGARINLLLLQFRSFFLLPLLLLLFFFYPLSHVKFTRQTDNTDGSLRRKPRTSKSEKR